MRKVTKKVHKQHRWKWLTKYQYVECDCGKKKFQWVSKIRLTHDTPQEKEK